MADSAAATTPVHETAAAESRFVEESLGEPPNITTTTTNTGDGLGDHCRVDRPTPCGQKPSGKIRQLGGVDVYISKPVDDSCSTSKFLLFLTGATGLHSVNNQIQADKFAKEGFLVVLPDMFSNDPLPGSATYEEAKDISIIEQMKLRVVETAKSFLIDMWLARQTPQKVIPIIKKVIEAAKDEFADIIACGGGIYSVGYCFGGRMTLLLASEKPDCIPSTSWVQSPSIEDGEVSPCFTGPYIKAGAICHATLISKEDFKGIKAPLSFICVENDQLFPENVKQYGEKILMNDNVEYEFKTYADVPHGFGVVGEYEDSKIKAAQAEAFEQILAWLQLH